MAKTYRTNFGTTIASMLEDRGRTQADVARATERSLSYVNQTLTGGKSVSPNWADLVSDVLNLESSERVLLHWAAAKDHGFKLELSS